MAASWGKSERALALPAFTWNISREIEADFTQSVSHLSHCGKSAGGQPRAERTGVTVSLRPAHPLQGKLRNSLC